MNIGERTRFAAFFLDSMSLQSYYTPLQKVVPLDRDAAYSSKACLNCAGVMYAPEQDCAVLPTPWSVWIVMLVSLSFISTINASR